MARIRLLFGWGRDVDARKRDDRQRQDGEGENARAAHARPMSALHPGRPNRRRAVARVERRFIQRQPLDDVPLELPADNRRRHDRAAEAPKIGQPAALAGFDADDKGYAQRFAFVFVVARRVVRVARVTVGSRLGRRLVLRTTGFRRMRGVRIRRGNRRVQQVRRDFSQQPRGRLGVALARPRQFFACRIAAAMLPAAGGRRTTAGVMLARKRHATLVHVRRQRQSDGGYQIGAQRNRRDQAAPQNPRTPMTMQKPHSRKPHNSCKSKIDPKGSAKAIGS